MDKPILNNPRKILFFLILTLVFLIPFFIIQANGSNCDTSSGRICNPLNENMSNIPVLIKTALEGFVKICIPLIVLGIIYCGFLFISAQGDTEKITKAKNALLYTIIGAAVLLGAWGLAQMISSTVLNFKKPQETTPTETFEPSPTPTDEPVEVGCPNPDYINPNENTTGFLRNLLKPEKAWAQVFDTYSAEHLFDLFNFTLIDKTSGEEYNFDLSWIYDNEAKYNFREVTLKNDREIIGANYKLNTYDSKSGLPLKICLFSGEEKENIDNDATHFNFTTKYPNIPFTLEKRTNANPGYLKTSRKFADVYNTINTYNAIESISSGHEKRKLFAFSVQRVERYRPDKPETFIINPTYKIVLNLFDSRRLEYVNSDMFIERLAASDMWTREMLEINKYILDGSYRKDLVDKYLNGFEASDNFHIPGNPSAKDTISYFRNMKFAEIKYIPDYFSGNASTNFRPENTLTPGPESLSFIYFNLMQASNGPTNEEGYEIYKKEFIDYYKERGLNKEPMSFAEFVKHLPDKINMKIEEILSHEYIHNVGNKKDLAARYGINSVYTENRLLVALNDTIPNERKKNACSANGCATYIYKPESEWVYNSDGSRNDDASMDLTLSLTHIQSPEETKADIGFIRDYLLVHYNFDHIKQFFSENEFNKLMNDNYFLNSLGGERMIKRYGKDKEKWILIMNVVAKNKTQNNIA